MFVNTVHVRRLTSPAEMLSGQGEAERERQVGARRAQVGSEAMRLQELTEE